MITMNNIIINGDRIRGVENYHEKQMPFLTVVQSVAGCYEVSVNDSPFYYTEEGGFFLTPVNARQRIFHHPPQGSDFFEARWVFMDVRLDGIWNLSDYYRMPLTLTKEQGRVISGYFDQMFALSTEDPYLRQVQMHKLGFCVLEEVLRCSERTEPVQNAKILPALAYLDENYWENPSSEELAERCSLSKSYFLKLFTQSTGQPPKQYLKMLKLKQAVVLMANTPLSIAEISAQLGFYDQFHFCREFKKMYGLAPSHYKQKRGTTIV